MWPNAKFLLLMVASLLTSDGIWGSAVWAQQDSPSQHDKVAVQKLVQALGSDKFQDREEASRKLVALGETALQELLQATTSSDPEVRRRATDCIEQIIPNENIARLLIQLQSPIPLERARAAIALKTFGQSAAIAVPALIRALDDTDAHVQDVAMNTLSGMGSAAKPAVAKLIAMLEDEKVPEQVRVQVLIAFSILGETASPATPTLLKLAKGRNVDQASFSVSVLGMVAKNEKAVIPVLLDLLKHPNTQVRANAAGALGNIGKEPDVVIPAIVEVLRKDKAKPPQGTLDTRQGILGGLSRFGPRAKPAIPILLEILTEEDNPFVLARVLWLLQCVGPEANEAVPFLLKYRETPYALLVEDDVARTLSAISRR